MKNKQYIYIYECYSAESGYRLTYINEKKANKVENILKVIIQLKL